LAICCPQYLDELEHEAERKGDVLQTLIDHFTKRYKAPLSASQAACCHN